MSLTLLNSRLRVVEGQITSIQGSIEELLRLQRDAACKSSSLESMAIFYIYQTLYLCEQITIHLFKNPMDKNLRQISFKDQVLILNRTRLVVNLKPPPSCCPTQKTTGIGKLGQLKVNEDYKRTAHPTLMSISLLQTRQPLHWETCFLWQKLLG